MFVISLIHQGQLKKTAIIGNPNEAVNLAHEWRELYMNECANDGCIFIDQQIQGQPETKRFASIRFDKEPDELQLYLSAKGGSPIFSSRYANVTKQFLITFLEYALIHVADYLKDRKRGK